MKIEHSKVHTVVGVGRDYDIFEHGGALYFTRDDQSICKFDLSESKQSLCERLLSIARCTRFVSRIRKMFTNEKTVYVHINTRSIRVVTARKGSQPRVREVDLTRPLSLEDTLQLSTLPSNLGSAFFYDHRTHTVYVGGTGQDLTGWVNEIDYSTGIRIRYKFRQGVARVQVGNSGAWMLVKTITDCFILLKRKHFGGEFLPVADDLTDFLLLNFNLRSRDLVNITDVAILNDRLVVLFHSYGRPSAVYHRCFNDGRSDPMLEIALVSLRDSTIVSFRIRKYGFIPLIVGNSPALGRPGPNLANMVETLASARIFVRDNLSFLILLNSSNRRGVKIFEFL